MVSVLSRPSTITILWLAGRSRTVWTSPLGHSILACRIPSWFPRPNQTRRELWDRKPDPILTNFDLEPAPVSMVTEPIRRQARVAVSPPADAAAQQQAAQQQQQ